MYVQCCMGLLLSVLLPSGHRFRSSPHKLERGFRVPSLFPLSSLTLPPQDSSASQPPSCNSALTPVICSPGSHHPPPHCGHRIPYTCGSNTLPARDFDFCHSSLACIFSMYSSSFLLPTSANDLLSTIYFSSMTHQSSVRTIFSSNSH